MLGELLTQELGRKASLPCHRAPPGLPLHPYLRRGLMRSLLHSLLHEVGRLYALILKITTMIQKT